MDIEYGMDPWEREVRRLEHLIFGMEQALRSVQARNREHPDDPTDTELLERSLAQLNEELIAMKKEIRPRTNLFDRLL